MRLADSMPLLTTAILLAAGATAQTTTRESLSGSGVQSNATSYTASASQDGRYVAFLSYATNLVLGDTNNKIDVFVRDRVTGQTTRVSLDSAGAQANNDCYEAVISADGRYVAFASLATNLVAGDTNATQDIFVHDRQTGQTTRASLGASGQQATVRSEKCSISANGRYVAFQNQDYFFVPGGNCIAVNVFVRDRQTAQTFLVNVGPSTTQSNSARWNAHISADGRFVAFDSTANDLVLNDTNLARDIFVYELLTGALSRVSVSSAGAQATGESFSPRLSADGRFVTFFSGASNLVPGDTNLRPDVFVRDRLMGTTTRVSVDSAGQQANDFSQSPKISADGRMLTFWSAATNLVAGDTNGVYDCFLHDRLTGATQRISVASNGTQANAQTTDSEISADGNRVVFSTTASNLVLPDTNSSDVYMRHAGSFAAATAYGAGCPGTAMVIPAIVGIGLPLLGNQAFAVGVNQGLPSSFALLAASLTQDNAPFSGCTLLLGGAIVTVGIAFLDAVGTGQMPFAIPSSSAALGITIYSQYLVVDPGGPVMNGATFSNGLAVLIGN